MLTWAVRGLADYRARGSLDDPEAVRTRTEAYRMESDAVARFLEECCLVNPHMWVETAAAHERFAGWARQDGVEPMSMKAFGQALDNAGYPISKANGRRVRRGIGLLAEDADPAAGGGTDEPDEPTLEVEG